MSKLRLFKEYTTFGKQDNETLSNQYVLTDNEENRREVIESFNGVDWNEDPENFINGNTDSISYNNYDDWDSPTGGFIEVVTREEELERLETQYMNQLAEVEDMFATAIAIENDGDNV